MNSILGDRSKLYNTEVVMTEGTIREYIRDNYKPNTLLIPLCGNNEVLFGDEPLDDDVFPSYLENEVSIKMNHLDDNISEEDLELEIGRTYADIYDYRLVQARMFRGEDFPLLNIKKICNTKDPRMMGLLGNVHKLFEWIDSAINKLEAATNKLAANLPIFVNPKAKFDISLPGDVKDSQGRVEWRKAKLLERAAVYMKSSYDKYMHGNKMVIWIPLWKVTEQSVIVLHLFDRIDVILS